MSIPSVNYDKVMLHCHPPIEDFEVVIFSLQACGVTSSMITWSHFQEMLRKIYRIKHAPRS